MYSMIYSLYYEYREFKDTTAQERRWGTLAADQSSGSLRRQNFNQVGRTGCKREAEPKARVVLLTADICF